MKKISLIAFIVLLVLLANTATLLGQGSGSFESGDIDDVMSDLERDFGFLSKEDIKQENLQTANEANREDIKIEEANKTVIFATTQSFGLTPDFSMAFSVMQNGIPVGSTVLGFGLTVSSSSPIASVGAGSFQILLTCKSGPYPEFCHGGIRLQGPSSCQSATLGNLQPIGGFTPQNPIDPLGFGINLLAGSTATITCTVF